MRPRSLLFTLFGDFLRYADVAVWIGSIIKYMEPFGFTEGATRVAISRMVQQGWLNSRKVGQKSYYRLTEKGRQRLEEGTSRVYHRVPEPWDGMWRVVVYSIPEDQRHLRDQFRKELQWRGFGPLSHTTWISPRNVYAQVMALIQQYDIQPYVDVFTARYDGPQTYQQIVQKAWNMASVEAWYEAFLKTYSVRFETLRQRLAHGDLSDRECFVERTLLVHEYRKFLFVDPNLPEELLPPNWIGQRAHLLFQELHKLLSPGAERFFAAHFDFVS
ncbi:PaaX family transcriptional regulator [Calditerricola satsumensis]|uniref:Phenylacetic acid degradation operon negative regulatory protein PaaX n=1 Tax=Calditerricola satsumensis TaxID=373054 RepID=A0A8J3FFE7_9BACI|nr:PaaX family transcriptional regulator C-terminal domain-containing protein [Calditerricola satsumensis]GGK04417.1 phenylacetic acid degradation operon negative regulatory protein PaaX [Calditerricola satsumensis]